MTGAPKIAAQNVIAEVESTGREAYTGAIGFASPVAGLELSVAIRTFEFAGDDVWLGVGGGVVADSDPAAEARECAVKAAPLLEAIGAREHRSRPAWRAMRHAIVPAGARRRPRGPTPRPACSPPCWCATAWPSPPPTTWRAWAPASPSSTAPRSPPTRPNGSSTPPPRTRAPAACA